MSRIQRTGRLQMLRVHNVGTGYGAPPNFLDTEVVLKLRGGLDEAYGFKLRVDANQPAREGMLGLLRDAMTHDWDVTIDYDITPGSTVGEIIRVAVQQ